MSGLRWVMDGLFPGECLGCAGPVARGSEFCPTCSKTLEYCSETGFLGRPFSCAYRHLGAVALALHRIKYRDRPDLVAPLVRAALKYRPLVGFGDPVCLVPVPLHPLRLVERGYNQAALVCHVLHHVTGWCWDPAGLRRVRFAVSQVHSTSVERRRNVEAAFEAVEGCGRGRPVVLVDDVLTTGSTLAACHEALHAQKIETAGFFTLSRATHDAPVGVDEGVIATMTPSGPTTGWT